MPPPTRLALGLRTGAGFSRGGSGGRSSFICAFCRQSQRRLDGGASALIYKPPAATAFRHSIWTSAVRHARANKDEDDFYALLLNDPLPTRARSTRQRTDSSRPPQPSEPASPPPSPPSVSSSGKSGVTAPPTPPPPPPPPPPSSSPSPSTPSAAPADVAARARVVFGSRLLSPVERAERRRERDAASTVVGGVRVPPRPAEPDNCCMSGCVNCVWDMYREELEEWAAARRAAERQTAEAMSSSSSSTSPPSSPLSPSSSPSSAVDRRSNPGSAPTTTSMDDDGGGSESLWQSAAADNDDDDGLLSGGASSLYQGIPVGIREFMRTEKRLGARRRERQAALEAEAEAGTQPPTP